MIYLKKNCTGFMFLVVNVCVTYSSTIHKLVEQFNKLGKEKI